MKKSIISTTSLLSFTLLALITYTNTAHADIVPERVVHIIGSTITNVVDTAQKNGEKNDALRNELVTNHSLNISTIQDKEKKLVSELNSSILNLENIQSRITEKTTELSDSGTDTSVMNIWLASSTIDLATAQNAIDVFASSTSDSLINTNQARELADTAINAVNTAHDDLQSALTELTNLI